MEQAHAFSASDAPSTDSSPDDEYVKLLTRCAIGALFSVVAAIPYVAFMLLFWTSLAGAALVTALTEIAATQALSRVPRGFKGRWLALVAAIAGLLPAGTTGLLVLFFEA